MVVQDCRIGCLGTVDLVLSLQTLALVMHCEEVVHEQAQFLQHKKTFTISTSTNMPRLLGLISGRFSLLLTQPSCDYVTETFLLSLQLVIERFHI